MATNTLLQPSAEKRNNWIDWAKAIGILLVVMGHSSYDNPTIYQAIFIIHMPLFFFISGYLFKLSESYRVLMIKIWSGLCIPYILYNLISALYFTVYSIIYHYTKGVWPDILGYGAFYTIFGIAPGIFNGPTWFLLALIWCKILCTLFHSIRTRWILFLIPLLAALWMVQYLTGFKYPFAIGCAITGMIWFEIGFLCKKYLHYNLPRYFWYVMVPICAITVFELMSHMQGYPNYVLARINGVLGLVTTGIALIGFMGLCMLLKNIHSHIIVVISKASIVIMCLHMLFYPVRAKLPYLDGNNIMSFIGDIAVLLILTSAYPLISRYFPAFTGGRK